MAATDPDLFLRAIAIEDNARNGQHGLGNVKGLNRKWGWREWAEEEGILKGNKIIMSRRKLMKLAEKTKPISEEALTCEIDGGPFIVNKNLPAEKVHGVDAHRSVHTDPLVQLVDGES
jgi:hypothetical protein